MTISLVVAMILSFVVTSVVTPYAIKYLRMIGVTSRDLHKKNKPFVPSSSGLPVIAGIIVALLFYIFIQVFIYKDTIVPVEVFAALTSILLIMLVGFLDDINSFQMRSNKFNEGKRGIGQLIKPLLTIPAALPMMAILAGTTTVNLPFVGTVDLGILYPLLIVPIAIVGASNMINMLGGFNGLEIGMGITYTLSLGLFCLLYGKTVAAVIFLTTFASLLAIFRFNFYPARILSGDSIQYLLGGVVAVGTVLGNIEKVALITMIPFLIQGALKFYGMYRLKGTPTDLGELEKDGSIRSRYGKKIYSLTHIVMNFGRFNEKQITLIFIVIQIFFSAIAFLL